MQISADRSEITTEKENPRSSGLHRFSLFSLVELMLEEERNSVARLEVITEPLVAFLQEARTRFAQGGRLFYVGAGSSGRLGFLDAAELLPTFSLEPGRVIPLLAGGEQAMQKAVEGAEDEKDVAFSGTSLTERDIVVGISASGTTPYVLGALEQANAANALTALLSSGEPPHDAAEHFLTMPTGAEIITGSTRLKAGTGTKIILNIISTALMVGEGRVFDHFMINLNPSNAKLRDRAIRIVQQLNHTSRENAQQALEQANWLVPKALSLSRPPAKKGALAALDGGGTKTRLLLFDEGGEVLEERIGGPTNAHRIPFSEIRATIGDLLKGLQPEKVVIGAAGATSLKKEWKQVLKELGYAEAEILHDGELLLSLLEETPGMIVIAGTGSVVMGKADGKEARVGGLGALLGDEGSGVAIGRAGLAAAIAAKRGWGPATSLQEAFGDCEALSRRTQSPLAFAPLGKAVCTHAEGDEVARAIICEQATALAKQVRHCAGLLEEPPEKLFPAGGVFSNALFYEDFLKALQLPSLEVTRLSDPFCTAIRRRCSLPSPA